MEDKVIGKVKWFNATKGYGFINNDKEKEDIFVHYSQIRQQGYRSLEEGEEVEFIIFKTKRGLQAREVHKMLTH